MDKNVRALVILAVVVVAAVLFFVLQSDEKTTPAPHEEAHVVHWSYEPDTGHTIQVNAKTGERMQRRSEMVHPQEANRAFEGADRRVYSGVRRQQPAGASAQ